MPYDSHSGEGGSRVYSILNAAKWFPLILSGVASFQLEMDPLTALSLAGNIVQFVEFSSKLLKEGHSLYKSRTGALAIHEELKLTMNDLRTLIAKVCHFLPKKK